MNIAYVVDSSYAKVVLISLFSAIEHSSRCHKYWIFCENLSDNEYDYLKQYSKKVRNVKLIEAPDTSKFPKHRYIPSVGFGRILLANYFIETFVYVDADLLFFPGWEEIDSFNPNKSSFAISAAPNHQNENYFNSGVLFINASRWKSELMSHAIETHYQKFGNSYTYGDQDLLNDFFGDKYLKIPRIFNWTTVYNFNKDVKILHFASPKKPWSGSALSFAVWNTRFYISNLETTEGAGDQSLPHLLIHSLMSFLTSWKAARLWKKTTRKAFSSIKNL